MVRKNLTAKQEKFVQELIKGKTQRQAYKAAYNAKNMSDAAIDSEASKLLKNPKVALRYRELKDKIVKRTEEKFLISVDEIIKEIVDIAKDDISNYLEFRTDEVFLGLDENGNPIHVSRPVVFIKDSRTINTKNISEVSIGKDGQVKLKTYARDTALYKLAEMLGVNEIAQAKLKLAEERLEMEKEVNSKKYWW